eukprot:gene13821-19738_t
MKTRGVDPEKRLAIGIQRRLDNDRRHATRITEVMNVPENPEKRLAIGIQRRLDNDRRHATRITEVMNVRAYQQASNQASPPPLPWWCRAAADSIAEVPPGPPQPLPWWLTTAADPRAAKAAASELWIEQAKIQKQTSRDRKQEAKVAGDTVAEPADAVADSVDLQEKERIRKLQKLEAKAAKAAKKDRADAEAKAYWDRVLLQLRKRKREAAADQEAEAAAELLSEKARHNTQAYPAADRADEAATARVTGQEKETAKLYEQTSNARQKIEEEIARLNPEVRMIPPTDQEKERAKLYKTSSRARQQIDKEIARLNPLASRHTIQVARADVDPAAEAAAGPVEQAAVDPAAEEAADQVAEEATDAVVEAVADLMGLKKRRREPEAMPSADLITGSVVHVAGSAATTLVAEVVAERKRERLRCNNQAYMDRKKIAKAAADLMELSKRMRETDPMPATFAVAEEATDPVAEAKPATYPVAEDATDTVAEAAADLMELSKRMRETDPMPATFAVAEEATDPVAEAKPATYPVAEEDADPVAAEAAADLMELSIRMRETDPMPTTSAVAEEATDPVDEVKPATYPVADEEATYPVAEAKPATYPVADEATDPVAEAAAELLELSKRMRETDSISAVGQVAEAPPPQRSRRKAAADPVAEAAADLLELSKRRREPEAIPAADPVGQAAADQVSEEAADPVVQAADDTVLPKRARDATALAAKQRKKEDRLYKEASKARQRVEPVSWAAVAEFEQEFCRPNVVRNHLYVTAYSVRQQVAKAAVAEFEQEFCRPNVVRNHLFVTAYSARQQVAKAAVAEFEQEFCRHDVNTHSPCDWPVTFCTLFSGISMHSAPVSDNSEVVLQTNKQINNISSPPPPNTCDSKEGVVPRSSSRASSLAHPKAPSPPESSKLSTLHPGAHASSNDKARA